MGSIAAVLRAGTSVLAESRETRGPGERKGSSTLAKEYRDIGALSERITGKLRLA